MDDDTAYAALMYGDPHRETNRIAAICYLAGRAELVRTIGAGARNGEPLPVTLTKLAAADTALAGRYGIQKPWTADLPAAPGPGRTGLRALRCPDRRTPPPTPPPTVAPPT